MDANGVGSEAETRKGGARRWSLRTAYALRQASRVAWFAAHGEVAQAITRRIVRRSSGEQPASARPAGSGPARETPDLLRLFGQIGALFRRDLANVEAGHYPLPDGEFGSPMAFLDLSRRFLADVPKVARRRLDGAHQEVFETDPDAARGLPRYYRQNFHFQTDGWLSAESARIYDFQVEVLFKGATAAMRRQALVPLSRIARRTDQRRLAYADIACGTGGLLAPALKAFPALKGTGVDLSQAYLDEAWRRLPVRSCRRACFVTAPAEALPFADASLDVLSTVYLFHELPPKIRRQAVAEFARVLKPGGQVIFADSLQSGDEPENDGLLELFPELFHEPYYRSYLEEDLDVIFAAHGLARISLETAFLTRIAVYTKEG
ncbi:MAG: ubiquinone biosynthesis protein [Stappia sp.]|uniref:class I SAM-dependent methyltransferase n=1 Tax=Stappia sp. TaxID=1870903 RepID=UPI000C4B95E6|nr:class I SAM-dependent methyltransferase [Stappia sp.]MAA97929.1 ubiquinone biosynthesis protein [Stappia sp.]MBM19657.1 ubiquinone biosynthesis protein [Stappia sp.]